MKNWLTNHWDWLIYGAFAILLAIFFVAYISSKFDLCRMIGVTDAFQCLVVLR